MTDPVITPEPTSTPQVSNKSILPIHLSWGTAVLIILGVAVFILYGILTKYSKTTSDLNKATNSLTQVTKNYNSVSQEYKTYQQNIEKNSKHYITYYENGNKKRELWILKSSTNTAVTITKAVTITEAVTVTQAVTIVEHITKTVESGTKLNGVIYVALPSDIISGNINSLGLGFQHSVIFDFWGGIEVGSDNLKDLLNNRYLHINIGHGIP
jgi:hypothetical protein